MKKIFFSLLAIAALASCAKTEAVYTEGDSEIKLAPVTSLATKTVYGAIDGTAYPTAEEFVVNAYWNGTTQYLTDVVFANKGQYWGGQGATYYWPKNGSLEFACYSPETVKIDYTYPNSWAGTYTQTENTAETTDLLIAPLTVPYTAQTATENVSVVFEHALSWITIKVKAANPEAAAAYTLHDIIVDQAFTTGTLVADMADGFKYNDWAEEKTAPADYYVVKGGNIALTTTAEVVEDAVAGTVVLPQVPTTLTINFTQNAMTGTPELDAQKVTVPLELDDETNNIWEPGKHYIYTVTFDVDEILINPSVVDWEDVVVEDKPFDEAGQIATVATEEELKAALAAKVAEIELTAEIALTSQLAVDYNVAFVGGGFSGSPIAVTGGVVSFENVAFANGNGTDETAVYVRNGNTNVTFQNCTFDAYKWEAIQYTSEDGLWVCVDGCTFEAVAHRDLHLQVKNASKAEVKITNNTFNGVDADSYVTVYGFDKERMILAGNVTETPANNVNVWISDLFDDTKLTLEGFATPAADDAALESALTQDAAEISVVLDADLTYEVAALDNDAMGGASTEVITIDLNGKTLTFNQTNSDWNNVTTAAGKLVIKNGHITNAGHNDGPWNRHDINFACPVELVNVTSDKALAFKSDATLTNVTIADANTSDTYAIWVQPNGQKIVLDGCTIDMLECTDGRGLKIDEQYVATPAKVTLKVSDTVFKTEEKSAILVKSVAGADITLSNVDITAVAADSTNPVWVDEASAAYADLVVVNGGSKIVEP